MLRLAVALASLLLVSSVTAAAPLWTHDAAVPVRDCAVSGDGGVIVVASDRLHLFTRNGSLVGTARSADDVALGAKSPLIAAATDDGVLAIARDGTERWTRPNRSAAVAMPGDGTTIAGVTPGGMLAIHDAAGARIALVDTGSMGSIVDLAVSDDGGTVVSIDGGGIRAFTGKGAARWSVDLANPTALAVNANGDLVAVGDQGSVKLYGRAGKRVARLATEGRVRSLATTPSGNLTVAGCEDGTVVALGPGGARLWVVPLASRTMRVAVSANGSLVAAAGEDGGLHLMDGNGTPLLDTAIAGAPTALALSADGSTVVVGSSTGTASVFDTAPLREGALPTGTGGTAPAVNGTGAATTAVRAPTTATQSATVSATGTDATAGATTLSSRTPNTTVQGTAIATATTPVRVVVLPLGTVRSAPSPLAGAAVVTVAGAWMWARRRRWD